MGGCCPCTLRGPALASDALYRRHNIAPTDARDHTRAPTQYSGRVRVLDRSQQRHGRKITTKEHMEMEVWMEDAEGAYRVSEVGKLGKLPTTVAEAQKHSHWELFRKAMEEEITGKMANQA